MAHAPGRTKAVGVCALATHFLLAGCSNFPADENAEVSETEDLATTNLGSTINATIPSSSPPVLAHLTLLANHSSATIDVIGGDLLHASVTGAGYGWNWTGEARVLAIPFLHPNRTYAADLLVRWDTGLQEQGTRQFHTAPAIQAYSEDPAIFPGAGFGLGGAFPSCTIAFLARDSSNDTLFAFTAAHCFKGETDASEVEVEDNGQRIKIGRLHEYHREAEVDWATIQLYPTVRSLTGPAVEHWTGPTRVAGPETAMRDDPLCLVGNGGIYNLHNAEQRARCGDFIGYHAVPISDDKKALMFEFEATAYVGDSGAPIVHHATGEAMGMLSGSIGYHGGPVIATPVCTALAVLAERGVVLEILTAQYSPPNALSVPAVVPQQQAEFDACLYDA